MACFVCIQSASNKSHVGQWFRNLSIIGCNICRDHGGFVIMKSEGGNSTVSASAVSISSDNGSMSDNHTHNDPVNPVIWLTRRPSPAQGSMNVNSSGTCRMSGSVADNGVWYKSFLRLSKFDLLPNVQSSSSSNNQPCSSACFRHSAHRHAHIPNSA